MEEIIVDYVKIIISLLGGLGLFIFGMKLMGDGLENAAGEGLKKILEKNDVNEEYIFDIMDKWAEERRVKTKGKWKK